jgi:hypothetical protein
MLTVEHLAACVSYRSRAKRDAAMATTSLYTKYVRTHDRTNKGWIHSPRAVSVDKQSVVPNEPLVRAKRRRAGFCHLDKLERATWRVRRPDGVRRARIVWAHVPVAPSSVGPENVLLCSCVVHCLAAEVRARWEVSVGRLVPRAIHLRQPQVPSTCMHRIWLSAQQPQQCSHFPRLTVSAATTTMQACACHAWMSAQQPYL